MASSPKASKVKPIKEAAVLAAYVSWLDRQPLADRTRDAYRAQVNRFLEWLSTAGHGTAALVEPSVRDWAVREYKQAVKAKGW